MGVGVGVGEGYLKSAGVQSESRQKRVEAVELCQHVTVVLRHHWYQRHLGWRPFIDVDVQDRITVRDRQQSAALLCNRPQQTQQILSNRPVMTPL